MYFNLGGDNLNIGRSEKYAVIKSNILNSALKRFLEKGYKNTTLKELASDSNIVLGSLTHIFNSKEEIVCELISHVLEYQFETANKIIKEKSSDKLLLYAIEITLQIHMAESSEHMREMYVTSYSMEKSSEVVYDTITSKLEEIFKEYVPHLQTKDFYEREIATGGIVRGFMSVPCNKYFTMERKIRSLIETIFLIYEVPKPKINEVTNYVLELDFEKIAMDTISSMEEYIESKI